MDPTTLLTPEGQTADVAAIIQALLAAGHSTNCAGGQRPRPKLLKARRALIEAVDAQVRQFVRGEQQAGAKKFVRPVMRWAYAPDLVLRGALLYERNEFKRLPHPEEVAAYDPAWMADINTMLELLKFHRDD
jgi:hypothetical protein